MQEKKTIPRTPSTLKSEIVYLIWKLTVISYNIPLELILPSVSYFFFKMWVESWELRLETASSYKTVKLWDCELHTYFMN